MSRATKKLFKRSSVSLSPYKTKSEVALDTATTTVPEPTMFSPPDDVNVGNNCIIAISGCESRPEGIELHTRGVTVVSNNLLFTALCDSESAEFLLEFFREASNYYTSLSSGVNNHVSTIKRTVEVRCANTGRVTRYLGCFPTNFQCTVDGNGDNMLFQVDVELAFDSYVIM